MTPPNAPMMEPMASPSPLTQTLQHALLFTSSTSAATHLHCPAGYYCGTTGLTQPSGLCPAGLYCFLGTGQPVHQCPIGYYCPTGSLLPLACSAGTICSFNSCLLGFGGLLYGISLDCSDPLSRGGARVSPIRRRRANQDSQRKYGIGNLSDGRTAYPPQRLPIQRCTSH